jgi:GntR family transcriptional regulator, arabinose operon transcriptional repressor
VRETARQTRKFSALVARISDEVIAGSYEQGTLLPSTRELAGRFGVSSETVRRALKHLEREGVLESRPRSGFRVTLRETAGLDRPLAYITSNRSDLSDAQPATWALSIALQGAGAEREWSILAAHAGDREQGAVLEQLKAGDARGVILDTIDYGLSQAVLGAGLPVVMVNSWVEDSPVDVVLQDNYRGGFLAAEHLLKAGIKRIGWIGHTSEFCHSRERFAGANAALSRYGLAIERNDCLAMTEENAKQVARKFLKRKDRPDGLLAFAGPGPIMEVAGELGLLLGRDFELVGWTVEEAYAMNYQPMFGSRQIAPAVVWSAREMADRALQLLDERIAGVRRRAVRACVATELRCD